MTTFNIYTDGSCYNGEGGYSYIRLDKPLGKIVAGGCMAVDNTTNNRMEMFAAITAIMTLPAGSRVRIYTDSAYLKDGFHHPSYLRKWMHCGWKTSTKKSVENQDLWEQLLALSLMYDIQFVLIKGHNDKNMIKDKHARYNYIVDKMCAYQTVRSGERIDPIALLEYLDTKYPREEEVDE